MTHIPDEAVQAAIRSFESTENNCETYQDMRKAISSAIQKICENIDFYDIKNELFGEMSRRFKNEKYIWESWKDFYPNPEYLPVDDTEIGVEFAFNFLERRILSCVVTKPVDVEAVRRQAFEEAAKLISKKAFEYDIEAQDVRLSVSDRRLAKSVAVRLRPRADEIRSLSAEPAQGEQWRDIVTVGERERLIIIGSYNAKGSWCAEVWHTKYLRDQQAKSASGFFMNAPHLEWVPTHFMELPAAPTTEV